MVECYVIFLYALCVKDYPVLRTVHDSLVPPDLGSFSKDPELRASFAEPLSTIAEMFPVFHQKHAWH